MSQTWMPVFGHDKGATASGLLVGAVAETLGVLIALSTGFTIIVASLDYPASTSITFNPCLLILIGGLAATLVGSWQLPKSQDHQPESAA
ncbi:hypothetical protein ACFWUP_24675 [Nocardia sp. NPDC058658]|uniref:hypothetical protein n=1 Tax=Nocardia sp. NPDC058658 TaxID=3346580 RepID=UPI00364759A5